MYITKEKFTPFLAKKGLDECLSDAEIVDAKYLGELDPKHLTWEAYELLSFIVEKTPATMHAFVVHEDMREGVESSEALGLPMHDKDGLISNMAVCTLGLGSRSAKIQLLEPSQYSGAIVLGNLSDKSELYAVIGIENALALRKSLDEAKERDACVLTLPSDLAVHFVRMVQDFKPHHIFVSKIQQSRTLNLKTLDPEWHCKLYIGNASIMDMLELCTLEEYLASDDIVTKGYNDWGTLIDLEPKSGKPKPYPLEAWGELADGLRKGREYLGVDEAMLAQSLLATISSAVGRTSSVQLDANHSPMPPNLFVITRAPSSAGKSKGQDTIMAELIKLAKKNKKMFKTATRKWDEMMGGAKEKEGKISHDLSQNIKPAKSRMTITNSTVPAMLDYILNDHHQRNPLLCPDEAGLFFDGMSMSKDSMVQTICTLTGIFSKGRFDRDTVTGKQNQPDKETEAHDIYLSFDILGQPVVLDQHLQNKTLIDQGLFPRFLHYLYVKEIPYNKDYDSSIHGNITNDADFLTISGVIEILLNEQYRYEDAVRNYVLGFPMHTDDSIYDGEPRLYSLLGLTDTYVSTDEAEAFTSFRDDGYPREIIKPTYDAYKLFKQYFADCEARHQKGRIWGNLVPYARRMPELAIRIACCFAKLDKALAQYNQNKPLPPSDIKSVVGDMVKLLNGRESGVQIEKSHLERAILLTECNMDQLVCFYGSDETQSDILEFYDWLRAKDGFTKSQIQQNAPRRLRGNENRDTLEKYLVALEECRYIKWESKGKTKVLRIRPEFFKVQK